MTDGPIPNHADVITPPPLIFLAGLAAGLLLDRFFLSLPLADGMWRLGLGLPPVVLGGVLIWLSFLLFRRAKTDVRPWKPSTAIIRHGPFRFSRNPIYVGMILAWIGAGFLFNTGWITLSLLLILPVMQIGVIDREEAYLEATFGDDYRAYKKSVRRWI